MTDNTDNTDTTDTTIDNMLLYRSPKAKVVFMKLRSILCVSNPDANTTEMEEGDDNW